MQITIELPDELADQIRKTSGDVSRRVLEAFAIDSYRSRTLTGAQARTLLGLATRYELDALLKRTGVFREYTADELERDYEASRQASSENLGSPNRLSSLTLLQYSTPLKLVWHRLC